MNHTELKLKLEQEIVSKIDFTEGRNPYHSVNEVLTHHHVK